MLGAQAGPSFPAARQTQQGACPGEGWGELSPLLPDMGMPHAVMLLTQEFWGVRRGEMGFSKVHVMPPPPPGWVPAPAR